MLLVEVGSRLGSRTFGSKSMHLEHLLRDSYLELELLWAEETLLHREISGATATDLEYPDRFLRNGEIVLTRLLWWNAKYGCAKAVRFVSALREAGVAALLVGVKQHGSVPPVFVETCREQGVPIVVVPAHVKLGSVMDALCLRKWRELNVPGALASSQSETASVLT
jgi:hypothetical protein